MFFPFGIEKEAEIYLASSKLGLQIDPQANGVINHLRNAFLEEDKVDLPTDEISSFIVQLCRENVLGQIDNYEDEKGVAWTIALLSKAYIVACSVPCSFASLFMKCFIKYYK